MSGERGYCSEHCLECVCTEEQKAIGYAIGELECALEDLRGQFDPKDGSVCARTVERVISRLESARDRNGEAAETWNRLGPQG